MRNANSIVCGKIERTVVANQKFYDKYLDIFDTSYNKVERQWIKCKQCDLIFHGPQFEVDPKSRTVFLMS